MISLVCYQPDIAQNLGTLIRCAACFDFDIHVIFPTSFPFDDRKFKRAAMDYFDKVNITKHDDWEDFEQWHKASQRRLVLLSTKSNKSYVDFKFKDNDIIMVGKESAGVPDHIHDYVDESLLIPLKNNMRSLNVAVSASIVISESLRQIGKL